MTQDSLSQGKQQLPEVQVLIPYKQLEELLQASAELKSVRLEMKRLRDQMGAMRSMLTEVMLQIGRKD